MQKNHMPRDSNVSGTTRTDDGVEVACNSYEADYPEGVSMEKSRAGLSRADLVQGYCSYGAGIGERGRR